LWASVLTRTRQRLVVVGDRSYWSGREGPLGDLEAEEEGSPPFSLDPATVVLLEKLRAVGTSATLHRDPDGRRADMPDRSGARRLPLRPDRRPARAAAVGAVTWARRKEVHLRSVGPRPPWYCSRIYVRSAPA